MARFDLPAKFTFKPVEWEDWIEEYNRFRRATKNHLEDGDIQRDALIYTMGGKEANKIFKTFKFEMKTIPDPADRTKTIQFQEKDTDYDTLVQKFTDYFIPRRNLIYERSIFKERKQHEGETVEEYVRELQNLVKHCDYVDPEDQVRDCFVIGTGNKEVSRKLQLVPDLTLETAVQRARLEEQVRSQTKHELSVNEIKLKKKSQRAWQSCSSYPKAHWSG